MKNRLLYRILLGLLVLMGLSSFCPVYAQLALKHGTGALQMTSAQRAEFHKKHARIKKIYLNHLGLTRVNADRKKKNLQLLADAATLPVGQEIEAAIDPNIDSAVAASPTNAASQSTTTAAVLAPAVTQSATLPSTVDNSTEPWFPPIGDQGLEGSCVAFSSTYYLLTYMNAASKGWTVSNGDQTKIFSPKWTYNMSNGGADRGSNDVAIFHILETNGAATMAQFPYNGTDYLSWDINANDWQSALSARINPIQYVANVSTSTGLSIVKQLLANGYLLTFDTTILSWQFTTIKQDPTSSVSTPYLGQQVAYWVNGLNGGHSMTIVGFDDSIWVDINQNGTVDPGERGALKIANQWGTGVGNAGFYWLAYDALKKVSAVSGAPSLNRVGALAESNDEAYELTVKSNYTPRLIAKFTVNTLRRNQLSMFLGTSATGANVPSAVWYPNVLNANINLGGGPYAFNGSTTAVQGSFVLDFTDILPSSNLSQNYYLGMSNNDPSNSEPSILSSYQLVDLTTNTTINQSPLFLPVKADGQTVYSSIAYTLNGQSSTTVAPTGVTATAGNGQVSLTWNNVTGIAQYFVKRGTSSGNYNTSFISSSSNYTDTTVSNGTTYYYVIQEIIGGVPSVNSIEVTATPQVPPMCNLSDVNFNDPSVFNSNFYLNNYPDLMSYYKNNPAGAGQHWITYGINEGRQANSYFNPAQYLALNPDVNTAALSCPSGSVLKYKYAISHYLKFGKNEGLRTIYPSSVCTLSDVNFNDSSVYDYTYYLNIYVDLKRAYNNNPAGAADHWITWGINEGRQAKSSFNTSQYLALNPDVNNYINSSCPEASTLKYKYAISHYLKYGKSEGRRTVQ